MRLQHKSFPTVDFKVLDEDQGVFEAYVSVFSVTDAANERVMPGFFKKSLATRLPKVVFAHDWDRPIGKTMPGTEERYAGDKRLPAGLQEYGGLYCLGQLNLAVQDGRDTLSHLKFGSLDEFSFGYDVTHATNAKDGVRELHEGTTYEVSPVLVGCNPITQLVSAKAREQKSYFAPAIQPSMTWAALNALNDYLFWSVTWECLFGESADEPQADRLDTLKDALGEYSDLFLTTVSALMAGAAGDEDMKAELEAEYKHVFDVPARIAGRFDQKLLALQTEAEDAACRAESLMALRKKQGRPLFSPTRREQLKALSEALTSLVEITAPTPDLDLPLLQMSANARRRRLLALGEGAPL